MGLREWVRGPQPDQAEGRPSRTDTQREAEGRGRFEQAKREAGESDRRNRERSKDVWPQERAKLQESVTKTERQIQDTDAQIASTWQQLRQNLDRAANSAPHLHGAEKGSQRQTELLGVQKDLRGTADLQQRSIDLLQQERQRLEGRLSEARSKIEAGDRNNTERLAA